MVIRRLEIRGFRGFEHVVIVPTVHALVVGEPRAGRPDVIEGLRRVLSADSTRSLLGDDIDFFQRSSACFPERRGRFLQLRRLVWASVRECPLLERSVRYGARRFAWRSSPVVIHDLDVVPVRV
jgi:hypothetical protein